MGKGAQGTAKMGAPPAMYVETPLAKLQAPQFRAHNYSAGAAALDTDVMLEVQAEFLNYQGSGMGIHEMSQRDPGGPVQTVLKAAEDNLRALLDVPDNYKVLFFQGGAHGQFSAIPLNLMGLGKKADYIVTGMWSMRAAEEASRYIDVNIPVNLLKSKQNCIPPVSEWGLSDDAAFVHFCGNETVSGLCLHDDPDIGAGKILIADMTSSLLSRPVDISKYGCVYASSGKNLGPPGVCVVIVREDLLQYESDMCPSILSWHKMSATKSIYNTPNTFGIYCLQKITEHLLNKGGMPATAQRAAKRSGWLYDAIDSSDGFYTNPNPIEQRSHTAIPFHIRGGDAELEAKFINTATEAGLLQVFGHASIGGLRICIYNGIADESVKAIVSFMADFQKSVDFTAK